MKVINDIEISPRVIKHERLGYICRDQKQDWIGDWSDTSEKGLKYFKRRISEYYGGLGRWQVVRLEKK
jgi:hypothetical protein